MVMAAIAGEDKTRIILDSCWRILDLFATMCAT
jgi:hypothetical protein